MTNFVFLNPGLLWGLLVVVVPIAIHFLLRRRPRVEKWGATRFLKVVVERNQTQYRVQSVSHLLLRVIILALIVLSAAEPTVDDNLGAFSEPSAVHRLLIVDVSMSMSATVDGKSRLDAARQQIFSLLSKAKEGDSWQLLLHGSNDQPERINVPTYETEILREEVSQLTPTYQATNIAETLTQALRLSEEFPGNANEILFWTDLPASEWDVSASDAYELNERLGQLSQSAQLTILDLSSKSLKNLAVINAHARTFPIRIGEPVIVDVTVTNHSASTGSTFVRLSVNSEFIAEETINLGSGKSRSIPFEVVFTDSGHQLCEVSIANDSLSADNTLQFAVPVIGETKILIIEELSTQTDSLRQSEFLRLALQADDDVQFSQTRSQYKLTVTGPSAFRDLNLDEFDVLVVCGISNLNENDATRLAEFVSSGGGVLFSMSEATSLNQYNNRIGPDGSGLLPGVLKERVSIRTTDNMAFQIGHIAEQHPIVAPFDLNPTSGLFTTRIYAYVQADLENAESATRIVDLESGDPLIIENRFGQGKVLLVTTAFNTEWGSWVLWPSFLPMISRAVDHLAQNKNSIVEMTIGKTAPVEVVDLQQISTIQNHEKQTVWDPQMKLDDLQKIVDMVVTRPGPYFIQSRSSHNTVQTLFGIADTAESNLKAISPRKLLAGPLLRGLPIKVVKKSEMLTSNRLTTNTTGKFSRSRLLIFAAILLLLIDQLFAYHARLAIGAVVGLLVGGLLAGYFGLTSFLFVGVVLICAFAGGAIASVLRSS